MTIGADFEWNNATIICLKVPWSAKVNSPLIAARAASWSNSSCILFS